MDVISGRVASTLNPYAAPYVPDASRYQAVEDFSAEWWALVDSSPYFRDYWLRECFQDPDENDLEALDICDPALSDTDFLFHSYPPSSQENERVKVGRELVSFGAFKWKGPHGRVAAGTRCFDKAPKIVSVKVSPRMIQQPR
ncbi:uncharacterized protein M6B38_340640 [Iris pallida]|uniref:Ataxin-2 C-terminal domain-containing protein n=1 Tax=Iris pallida TaxID=29817 RepID=A0AAX6F6B1_IRIPA|nr:uncharacterized protein M6B38_153330 [Iris pallida]KAJ6833261.1 uncharacterized protein M6B38_340640 [Iris pallida]